MRSARPAHFQGCLRLQPTPQAPAFSDPRDRHPKHGYSHRTRFPLLRRLSRQTFPDRLIFSLTDSSRTSRPFGIYLRTTAPSGGLVTHSSCRVSTAMCAASTPASSHCTLGLSPYEFVNLFGADPDRQVDMFAREFGCIPSGDGRGRRQGSTCLYNEVSAAYLLVILLSIDRHGTRGGIRLPEGSSRRDSRERTRYSGLCYYSTLSFQESLYHDSGTRRK